MSDSVQQLRNSTARRSDNVAGVGSSIPPSLFVLFAFELFLMGAVIWYFLINRYSFPDGQANMVDMVWGLIAVAALGWGTWYLAMAHPATLSWRIDQSRYLLAIAVASGAILLGILALNIATAFVASPVYMDIRPKFASAGAKTTAPSALVGDAANGKKWFGMSCITCHGPTGDGVANAAPSLRASEFLKTADDLAIASLIRNGRAAKDPANKTGKVMPAKGGNPFLDESKIADLVSLLNDLEGQFGATSSSSVSMTGSTDSNSSDESTSETATVVRDSPQLSRWVVPLATSATAPSNWATSKSRASRTYADSVSTHDSSRYASAFSWLFVTATSVLAMHFLWVVGLGAAVVMHQELQLSSGTQVRVGKQMVLFWSIGSAWLILWFVLFFLIG